MKGEVFRSGGTLAACVGEVLLRIETGKSVKTQERPARAGESGILKLSAVTWGEFRPWENKAILEGYAPGDCPRPMDGDLLISRANTRELVGAPVIVLGNHPQLLLSDKILRLVPNLDRVEPRYLVRALRAATARAHFESRAGGTSGSMTNITQEDIRSAPIPLVPLSEQRRIAEILDRAEALRAKRRAALAQLDTLNQSIFLDLFGDPSGNRWDTAPVSDYVEHFEGGKSLEADAGAARTSNRVLKISAVTGMKYRPEESKPVPDNYQPPPEHFVKAGDLLFSRANTAELVGAVAYVDETPPNVLLPDKLWRLVWRKPIRVEPLFVWALFQTPAVRQEIQRRATGTSGSMKNISKEKLRGIRTLLPPLPLQREFVRRCAVVEKVKSTQRRSLAEFDVLFSSLQHRAFRGEL
jgi:type I restriction enzyme, S subunit